MSPKPLERLKDVLRHPLALIVLSYLLITLLITAPLVSIGELSAPAMLGSDPGLVMWTIAWVNHAILNQCTDLFAANAFYPYPGSLSYSEHGFGVAVLAQPWFWFSDDPVTPYNLLLLLAYFGSAIAMYSLVFAYSRSHAGAFVAGVIFGFCFYRTHHFGHLTLISTYWLPLSVLLLRRLRALLSKLRNQD